MACPYLDNLEASEQDYDLAREAAQSHEEVSAPLDGHDITQTLKACSDAVADWRNGILAR
ncbi:MAG: hypothetical protein F4X27_14045 [Chloroflexi bacterium]|nr:hypothetical protein [Chloroflexota bacterium]